MTWLLAVTRRLRSAELQDWEAHLLSSVAEIAGGEQLPGGRREEEPGLRPSCSFSSLPPCHLSSPRLSEYQRARERLECHSSEHHWEGARVRKSIPAGLVPVNRCGQQGLCRQPSWVARAEDVVSFVLANGYFLTMVIYVPREPGVSEATLLQ